MHKKIWNPEMECATREDMRALQSERLKNTVRYTYDRVKIYRDKMDEAGITPDDIQSIDDITKLPFTTKEDLMKDYPSGMWAADPTDIVRIHASSGTTGNPKVLAFTRTDLDNWAESVARGLTMAGQDENSVVQVAYGYGLFTGGLGAHQGAEKIGATVIPMSSGNTKKQLNMMKNLKSSCLCCTPSYALTITEAAHAAGMTPEEIPLQSGVFGAEPWSKAMKEAIETGLGIEAHDIYGLTEITGPGVATSCNVGEGMHVAEDLFFPEIIDPVTLEPLPDGEKGELVFTTLSKEGVPMLRYRTRDICYITHEPCACGRTSVRMSRIFGRTDDMLIIKGVNVFPSQIEAVIGTFEELTINYKILVGRKNDRDTFELQVELANGLEIDDIPFLEDLRDRLNHALREMLGIGCKLTFLSAGTLARSEGKAVRVVDTRNFND